MKQPIFEAVITQPIEICFPNSGSYRTAKTMEEALRVKAEMEREAREQWLSEKNSKAKQEHLYDFIRRNVENYAEHLKKRLWHDQRDGTAKEVVEVKKRIMDDLKGIIEGKVAVEWHQQMFRTGGTYYTVRLTTKEERDEMGV